MATEINVPTLGESVTSATVARWMKHEGEAVAADEPLVELETDKVTVEVSAPSAGVLTSISAPEGSEVPVGALLGLLEAGASAAAAAPKAAPKPAPPPEPRPAAMPQAGVNAPPRALGPVARPATPPADVAAHAPLPAAAKLIEEQHLSAEQIGEGSGKDGRITKGDVLAFLNRPAPAPAPRACGEAGARSGAARRARAHDAAAPHDRGAAEGGAEHRRDADHLQRGGHVRGDGTAQRVPRRHSRRSTTASVSASCRSS